MLGSQERLIELAGAIADGTAVDWPSELASPRNADDQKIIEQLQAIAALASVNRSPDDSTHDLVAEDHSVRTSWGPLQLRRVIGRGSFGTIYLAWDPGLEREVVVKIMERSNRTHAIFQEARLLARVRHPNVVTVYRVEEFDGVAGIEMELVDGQTLKQVLEERGIFGAHETALIGTDVCRAVAAVHKAGLIHRDIKAQNVMREAGGRIVLMDFGAGQVRAERHQLLRRLTGTPLYLAPDVLNGQPASVSSDIYSIGVLLYHLLTKRFPVEGETLALIEEAHADGRVTPIGDHRPDLPAGIVQVATRALDRDPARRYQSAGAMQQELLATMTPAPASGRSEPDDPSTADHRRSTATDRVLDVTTVARTGHRSFDTFQQIRQAFAESRWLSVAATIVLLGVLAVPMVWIYRDRVEPPTAALLPDNKIVVVLPFKVIGSDKEERLYSEGVSEMLTSALVQLGASDLQVMPASEIRQGRIDTAEKARTEFGATLVLAGAVQFSGSQVRVSYSLIRAADHRELVARSNTLAAADPFALQDVVIRGVLAMLKSDLTAAPREPRQIFGTRDARAAFLYTEARGALQNYYEQDNVDKAISLLTQAVERDPQYAVAYAVLGQAFWQNFITLKQLDWLERARQACETSVSLNPQLSDAHLCLGLVYEGRGEYELARESYQRAVDYSPTNDEAQRALGSVLSKLGRVKEAEAAYLKAIDLRPGYWASYARVAQFYTLRNDLQNLQKANDYYYKALALSPDNARVLYSLGLVFANAGQYDRAAEFLERAIQLRPSLVPPYGNLGLAYLRARRYDKAVAPLEKAFSLLGDYQTAGNLARIYWLTGRKEEARQRYEFGIRDGEQRLQQDPRDHGIQLLVGRYYAMLGKKPEALSHIDVAFSLHPDDPHYLTIAATARVALGDRATALSLMEQAASLGYTSVQFLAEPELDVLKAEPRYIAVMSANVSGR